MQLGFNSALVTGGAGFIGSHLVDELIANHCRVSVIDNLTSGNLNNIKHVLDQITFFQGDIQDDQILARATEGCEVIFHQAAVVSVTQTIDHPIESAMVNDIGTLKILETAKRMNVKKVIIASSCAVYGDTSQTPISESTHPKPLSPYAVQKLSGELNAKIYRDLFGLPASCLRYFNVYGPRQDPSSPYSGVISIFMTKAVHRESPLIYGDGNQSRDFIFVKDVVKANLTAAANESVVAPVFNIGTGTPTTINQLWKRVQSSDGLDLAPHYQPKRSGDIYESFADMTHTRKQLQFSADYTLEEGLGLTYQWYKNQKNHRSGR